MHPSKQDYCKATLSFGEINREPCKSFQNFQQTSSLLISTPASAPLLLSSRQTAGSHILPRSVQCGRQLLTTTESTVRVVCIISHCSPYLFTLRGLPLLRLDLSLPYPSFVCVYCTSHSFFGFWIAGIRSPVQSFRSFANPNRSFEGQGKLLVESLSLLCFQVLATNPRIKC